MTPHERSCKSAQNIMAGKKMKKYKLVKNFPFVNFVPQKVNYHTIMMLIILINVKKIFVDPTDSTYPKSAPVL